jgi:putative PIN family toxin of toxin-antitoxin system
MRVVIDTNAFISAVLFEGSTSALLKLWQTRKIVVLLSPDIIDEYPRGINLSKVQTDEARNSVGDES